MDKFTWPTEFIDANRPPRETVTTVQDFTSAASCQDGCVIVQQDPTQDPNDGMVTLSDQGTFLPWVEASPLPRPEAAIDAAVRGAQIFLPIGGLTAAPDSLLRGNVQPDGSIVWKVVGAMPNAAYESECVIWQNYLYVIGSESSGEPTQVIVTHLDSNGVPSDWRQLPSPTPNSFFFSHAVVVHDGNLFTLGGGDGNGGYRDEVNRARILADGTIAPWETLDPLPTPVLGGEAVVAGGHLWYMGGYNYSGGFHHYHDEIFSAAIDASGNLALWQYAGTLPDFLSWFSSTPAAGQILVVGGYACVYPSEPFSCAATNAVQSIDFDPATGMVTAVTPAPPLPTTRNGHTMANINGRLYVLGGANYPSSSVNRSDLAIDGSFERIGTYTKTICLSSQKPLEYLIWTGSVPDGAEVKIQWRTAGADGQFGTWSGWRTDTQNQLNETGQHLQFQLRLTSSGSDPPNVQDVTLHYRETDPGQVSVGTDVVVGLPFAGSCTFDNVTEMGVLTNTPPPDPPFSPPGYRPVKHFDLSTTALFFGTVKVNLTFSPSAVSNPGAVRLFHWDAAAVTWDDITDFVDDLRGMIKGRTPFLSPFLIAEYDGVTGVNDVPDARETALTVTSYPNPFNPSVTITFSLPSGGAISLAVYDVAGRKVRSLFSGRGVAGPNQRTWDGLDDAGNEVSAGVYFCRVKTTHETAVAKLVLVK